jgi:hypothetical protein
VKRNDIQHLKGRAACDVIELIQLREFLGEGLQVPTGWRGCPSFSPTTIERTVPFQNPIDRWS